MQQTTTHLPSKKSKIANFYLTREQVTFIHFKTSIVKVCVLIGCPVPVSAELILWELYGKKFSDINLSEFELAFEMNLNRELEFTVYNGKEWETIDRKQHYHLFSGEFMTDVLQAYQAHRFKILNEVKELEIKSRPQLKESDEVINTRILKMIEKDFDKMEEPFFPMRYDLLVEMGIINLTREQKQQYVEDAKAWIRTSLTVAKDGHEATKISEVIREFTKSTTTTSEVKYEAKRLAYVDFLKDKTNIEKLTQQ